MQSGSEKGCWTAFINSYPGSYPESCPERAALRRCGAACAILATDVNTFVCCKRLDGDRRFEDRFFCKFPL